MFICTENLICISLISDVRPWKHGHRWHSFIWQAVWIRESMAEHLQDLRSQSIRSNWCSGVESRWVFHHITIRAFYVLSPTKIYCCFPFAAFSQMGFNFSPQFTQQLTAHSQDHKEVTVDEFIVLCVTVQRLTEAFRVRDTQQNGMITINFEDFLTVVLTNTNWVIAVCVHRLFQRIFFGHSHNTQMDIQWKIENLMMPYFIIIQLTRFICMLTSHILYNISHVNANIPKSIWKETKTLYYYIHTQ